MRQWISELNQEVKPRLESVRAMKALADQIRPLILVVDDDGFQCKVLSQVLGSENYELVFAASGTKALAALQKRAPDLILMDINMPDLDGVEVTRRLKATESTAGIPVIMITGRSEKSVVVDSLKAGAADFIVKPFEKNIVHSKIAKFLHSQRLQ